MIHSFVYEPCFSRGTTNVGIVYHAANYILNVVATRQKLAEELLSMILSIIPIMPSMNNGSRREFLI